MSKQVVNHTNFNLASAVSEADFANLNQSVEAPSPFSSEVEQGFAPQPADPSKAGAGPNRIPNPPRPNVNHATPDMPPILEPDMQEGPEALMAVSNIDHYSFANEEISNHRPVPRINIHVFCETPQVAHLIQSAGADRRLSKASVELFDGGIKSAISYYSHTGTPNLIIVETYEKHRSLIETLNELAMVCDQSTKVVVIGAANDVRLYRDLMKRGISEYLVAPRSASQIISTISDLYTDPGAEPIGKTYAFIGSRGGSGSSVISHNVAWALAERYSSNTVLMDLDLPFGTVGLDFECDSSGGVVEAMATPERLDAALMDGLLKPLTDRLSLFTASNTLEQSYDGKLDSIETIIDVVRNAAPSIVIDIPHGWSTISQYALYTADEIVITCTPDLASFRNAKNIVEHLKSKRVNDVAPMIVMNQIGINKNAEVPIEQFKSVLGIAPFTIIQWDPVVFGSASTNGSTVFEVSGKSKVASSISAIAAKLAGYPAETTETRSSPLKALFKKN